MGSHITTNTKRIKTSQLNLKSKVIAAILNYIMKTFAISSLIFLIVAIAIIGNATGKRTVVASGEMSPACLDHANQIKKCLEGSGSGSAEVVACCKEKGVSEECIKYCEAKQPSKQLQK